MPSVQEHFAYVLKYGLARNNRFQVIIPLPPAMQQKSTNDEQSKISTFLNEDVISLINSFTGGGTAVTRGLDVMVEETELPGKNITTTDIRYNGDYYHLPYGVVYEAQNFVFRATKDMFEKNVIDEWMNFVFNPISHEVAYMEDFVTNIIINQLDAQDNIVYSVMLKDAFPTMCNPLTLSNESQDEYHRVSVSFMYRRWERVGERENSNFGIDSLTQSPLGPFINPVLNNPAVQKSLEVFERNTGLDLEGEAVNIYNQVDGILKQTTGQSINKSVSLIESVKSSTESNNSLSNDQKSKVINAIDEALGQLRS